MEGVADVWMKEEDGGEIACVEPECLVLNSDWFILPRDLASRAPVALARDTYPTANGAKYFVTDSPHLSRVSMQRSSGVILQHAACLSD